MSCWLRCNFWTVSTLDYQPSQLKKSKLKMQKYVSLLRILLTRQDSSCSVTPNENGQDGLVTKSSYRTWMLVTVTSKFLTTFVKSFSAKLSLPASSFATPEKVTRGSMSVIKKTSFMVLQCTNVAPRQLKRTHLWLVSISSILHPAVNQDCEC